MGVESSTSSILFQVSPDTDIPCVPSYSVPDLTCTRGNISYWLGCHKIPVRRLPKAKCIVSETVVPQTGEYSNKKLQFYVVMLLEVLTIDEMD